MIKVDKPCKVHPQRLAISFCVKCGSPLCPECEYFVGNRPHCKSCAQISRQGQLSESIKKIKEDVKIVQSYYDWKPVLNILKSFPLRLDNLHSRRILAFIFDIFLILLLSAPLQLILKFLLQKYIIIDSLTLNLVLYSYVALMFSFFYFIIPTWIFGKSFGKHLFNLRVVWKTGREKITLFSSIWRWIGMIASLIYTSIGLIIYLFLRWIIKVFELKGFLKFSISSSGLFILVFLSSGLLIGFIGKDKRNFSDALAGTKVIYKDKSK